MAIVEQAPPHVLVHARDPADRDRFAALLQDLGAEIVDLEATSDADLDSRAVAPILAQTGGPRCPLDRLLPSEGANGRGSCGSPGRPLILLTTREHLDRIATRTAGRPHAILLAEPLEREELMSVLRASLAIEERQREIQALMERLDRSNDELERRRREAEMESRRRTQFLAAISHDLRTPLWEIDLFGQVVKAAAGDADSATPVDWDRLATGLLAGVATLRERVDDLFDLARLDLGAIERNEERFLLGPFLDRVLASYRAQAEAQGLAFLVESAPPWAELVADADKISRILQNLASNAVKFTERGEIRVAATVEPSTGLVLSVRDTGRGIRPEALASIFDEFAQIDNPERDRAKGTGLGLAICRRLAGLLGGTIEVSSEPGQGSEFTLRLPEVGRA